MGFVHFHPVTLISPTVPEKNIFKGFLPYMGMAVIFLFIY